MPIIYRDEPIDLRKEAYEVQGRPRELMRSIGLLLSPLLKNKRGPNFTISPETTTSIGQDLKQTFATAANVNVNDFTLDKSIRFQDQPTVGHGTCFLVADDLIMTAAHCVVDDDGSFLDYHKFMVLFDFCLESASQTPYEYKLHQKDPLDKDRYNLVEEVVVTTRRGSRSILRPSGYMLPDFAILRLKRPVSTTARRAPLQLSKSPAIVDDNCFAAGHPIGSLMKYSNGMVANARFAGFDLNSDCFQGLKMTCYHGDSGAPVFNHSGEVCGMMTTTFDLERQDFYVQPSNPTHILPKMYPYSSEVVAAMQRVDQIRWLLSKTADVALYIQFAKIQPPRPDRNVYMQVSLVEKKEALPEEALVLESRNDIGEMGGVFSFCRPRIPDRPLPHRPLDYRFIRIVTWATYEAPAAETSCVRIITSARLAFGELTMGEKSKERYEYWYGYNAIDNKNNDLVFRIPIPLTRVSLSHVPNKTLPKMTTAYIPIKSDHSDPYWTTARFPTDDLQRPRGYPNIETGFKIK